MEGRRPKKFRGRGGAGAAINSELDSTDVARASSLPPKEGCVTQCEQPRLLRPLPPKEGCITQCEQPHLLRPLPPKEGCVTQCEQPPLLRHQLLRRWPRHTLCRQLWATGKNQENEGRNGRTDIYRRQSRWCDLQTRVVAPPGSMYSFRFRATATSY